MKLKFSILPALFFAVSGAVASDCVGDGCDTEITEIRESVREIETILDSIEIPAVATVPCVKCANKETFTGPLSDIAPWDGVHGEYEPHEFWKTVDVRDGVPIWDDSVSHYRDRDYRDAYVPRSVVEIEELLAPRKPCGNIWTNQEIIECDYSWVDSLSFSIGDGCPFETDVECAIWRRKPMVRETVSPRSTKLREDVMQALLIKAQSCGMTALDAEAAPLLERYKQLMDSSKACCNAGMAHELVRSGASKGLVYKFFVDDANFYNIGARCLVTTDSDLDRTFPNTATSLFIADVRNGCLCRRKQWFMSTLAPFLELYEKVPEFAESNFEYTFIDGLGRETHVDINRDVSNVLDQLALCP